MNTLGNAISAPPFQGMHVIAFVLGLIGLINAWIWWREREPGSGWFAPSFGLAAVFAATAHLHNSSGTQVSFSPWLGLVLPAMAGFSLGLLNYLRLPIGLRHPRFWALLIPALLYLAVLAYMGFSGSSLPRQLASLPVIFWFLALGSVAWRAGSREPDAGHRIVAVSLWTVPAITVTVALVQLDSVLPRYYGFPPLIVMGLMMIPVGLLRRRRALEAEVALRGAAEAGLARLNASLEQTVTERTADLQNLVAGLESFNRSVSHDLRGSLGGIGGLARLAHESLAQGDTALARRALPLIAEQAEKSQQLMATLLTLAKVSDAKLQRERVDLPDLVSQVLQQIALERGDAPLPQIVLAPAMPSLHADPALLKPVLANLIGNAIKFSRDAQAPRIDIGARPSEGEEGSGVTVEVKDNGIGFDPQTATALFTPFVRLSEARFDGHGIGLSIVRRAVERHGGRVWAESHPGEGAIFRFSLPN